jgi:hypothetical protein
MNTASLLCTFLALTASLTASLSAATRTWTSADGRQIQAEYLGRAADGSGLVLARSDTGARVTVPLNLLSAEDQAHAETLGTTPFIEPAPAPASARKEPSPELRALAAAWPAPVNPSRLHNPYWDVHHNRMVELQRLFEDEFRSILSGDVAHNVRTLRVQVEREITRLRGEAGSSASGSTEAMQRRAAAQFGLHWLSTAILPHLAQIEAAAAK